MRRSSLVWFNICTTKKLKKVKTKSTKWLRLHSQVRLDQLTSLRFMKQFNKWLSSWNSRQIPGSPDLSRWDGAETEKLGGKLAHIITPPPPCCTAWFWSAESDSILVQHLVSPPQQLLGSQIFLSCTLISKFSPVYLWITADEIKTHLGRLRGSEPTATRIHMKFNSNKSWNIIMIMIIKTQIVTNIELISAQRADI